MDPEIRESILGHAGKGKSVSEGYGRIGDQELIKAIENKTFDHGSTEIVVGLSRFAADRGLVHS
jgi:hypothetical protein